MSVYANENGGSVTLTVDGRDRNLSLEDAEKLLNELEEAVESAKEQTD